MANAMNRPFGDFAGGENPPRDENQNPIENAEPNLIGGQQQAPRQPTPHHPDYRRMGRMPRWRYLPRVHNVRMNVRTGEQQEGHQGTQPSTSRVEQRQMNTDP